MENKGESDHFSRDSRESRDSRDSFSEMTPFVMTPFSGLDFCEEGTLWDSSLPISLTLWDAPVLCTARHPSSQGTVAGVVRVGLLGLPGLKDQKGNHRRDCPKVWHMASRLAIVHPVVGVLVRFGADLKFRSCHKFQDQGAGKKGHAPQLRTMLRTPDVRYKLTAIMQTFLNAQFANAPSQNL